MLKDKGEESLHTHLVQLNGNSEAVSRHLLPFSQSDRVCPPEKTLARMKPRLAEFGITRLARLTGLDVIGLPVWSAIRPKASTLAVSQGKGITDTQAQVSAVMEAVELAVAETPQVSSVHTTRRQLERHGAVTETCKILLRRGAQLPENDDVLDWVSGYDLVARRTVCVPLEAVRLSSRAQAIKESRYWQSTDGLASGNNIWEATVHGLFERIERDASSLLNWRSEADIRQRCIDIDSIRGSDWRDICQLIKNSGLELRLFDITTDVDVPAFFATVCPTNMARSGLVHYDVASGRSCHLCHQRAAIGAVTEAVQSRLTTIAGARDDLSSHNYTDRLSEDLGIYLDASPKAIRYLPRAELMDRQNYIPLILEKLQNSAIKSVIVVPLNRSDETFSVVKVLVLDLENPPGDRASSIGLRALVRALKRP